MATNKRVFTLRLSDEVFDKIGVLATREHRSMTNYIEYVLLKHINDIEAEQGEIKEENDRCRGRFLLSGGERSNAAPQAVRRRAPVTRAPRSRARLISATNSRRFVAKPRTPHPIPQAAQLFKCRSANVRGRGQDPSSFLSGV